MVEDEQEENQTANITAEDLSQRHSGVLSDEDIKAEIRVRDLISTKDGEDCSTQPGVRGDCYDVRIGHLISKRQGVKKDQTVALRPGELVTLLSKERVRLPANIVGLVIPRNGQAQRGILILNAGHVEPWYSGQIMAQVVNMSDQERSIQLENSKDSVFSIVFSYVHTDAKAKPSRPEITEDDRVKQLYAAALEQAETLVMAESVMREKFVAHDAFTRLLYLNAVGFMALVAILVTVSSAFVDLRELTKSGLDLGAFLTLSAVVFVGVVLGRILVGLLLGALIKRWPWWRGNFLS